MKQNEFLPVSREDILERGWYYYDFLVVTGDAYVDHPSFGSAIIGRLLEADGYRVAILAQPYFKSCKDFSAMGKPRYGVLISGGNVDSMVCAYTAAKRRRSEDYYSPGMKAGLRPDRAVDVYCSLVREAFGDIPIVIGGLEASLRRFAHYDYWADKVLPSVIVSSGADILSYGMGERSMREIARRLRAGESVGSIRNVRGTCVLVEKNEQSAYKSVYCPSYEEVLRDGAAEAKSVKIQYDEQDAVRGLAVLQRHGEKLLVQNPPSIPIDTAEFDRVAELPYMREPHPMYEKMGGVKSIEEVKFSITHNRGCFGFCNFCSLAFHQGRAVSVRSHESILREAEMLTKLPDFKGYIHDVGGPTANFRHSSCKQQLKNGLCKDRRCLSPTPCPSLDADHSDYLALLRKLRAIPGVKKVFIRSGIRYDYLMKDKNGEFFAELVKHHISGQLKVAPEHICSDVLDYMAKPHFGVYRRFEEKYKRLNEKYSKKQFLVPYLISSHPGSTLFDAVKLAEYLHSTGHQPEQVQDFYPTPGTLAAAMYHTGIDPRTMEPVFVAKSPREKSMQRALLQWKNPKNHALVLQALRETGRMDLVGFGKNCLVKPRPAGARTATQTAEKKSGKSGDKRKTSAENKTAKSADN